MLKPDIFLGSHTEYFNFEDKQKRMATERVKAWITRPVALPASSLLQTHTAPAILLT